MTVMVGSIEVQVPFVHVCVRTKPYITVWEISILMYSEYNAMQHDICLQ